MISRAPLLIMDIPWLRLAAGKRGALGVPAAISGKLLKAGFVRADVQCDCLRITRLGELALTRLG